MDGKIYAIGGWNNAGDVSVVEMYDPPIDRWTKRADMPTARTFLSASVVDGKIYVIGGSVSPNALEEHAVKIVEAYDPATNTWSRKADMPTARKGLATSVVNGKIYAIGGGFIDFVGGQVKRWEVLSTVEMYDPQADTWTLQTPMPTRRWLLSTAVVDAKIYALGGWSGITNLANVRSTVEIYTPATDTWTKGADMPDPRGSMGASAISGKIYVIGGQADFVGGGPVFSTVMEYDTGFKEPPSVVNPAGKLAILWGKLKAQ